MTGWTELARRHGGYLAGGFCERDGADLYNSAVLVDAGGIILHYRKLHLFSGEKQAFAPGDRGLPVVDTPMGRIGVCVCYDLRFVETVRILSLRGAQLILVPTAWVAGFDREPMDGNGVARASATESCCRPTSTRSSSPAHRRPDAAETPIFSDPRSSPIRPEGGRWARCRALATPRRWSRST